MHVLRSAHTVIFLFYRAEDQHRKIKNTIKSKIERKFSKFYPEFKKKFIFQRYLTSIRTILYNKNDARVCLVENDNNFVNILSGKIDHIFYAASEVIKCLNKY